MFSSGSVSIGNVNNYAQAHALWERRTKTRTGRARKEHFGKGYALCDAAGGAGHTRFVRKDATGAILFKLYSTDVVTYHPDDSISIEPYASKTTAEFARGLLPCGVHLGVDGTITLNQDRPDPVVCSGKLTFKQSAVDRHWQIVAGKPKVFTDIRVDRRALRVAMIEHNLPAFKLWLNVADAHGVAPKNGGKSCFNPFKPEGRTAFFEAVKAKRFVEAADLVPYMNDSARYSFGRAIDGYGPDAVDWSRIELHLASEVGATRIEEHTVIPVSTYRSMCRRVKQAQAKGLPDAYLLGW